MLAAAASLANESALLYTARVISHQLRHADEADLPRIVDIYNATIPGRMATAELEPVSVESRRPWFDAHSPEKHPLWVCESDGQVLGWIGLRPFYGRAAYHSTAEVSVYLAAEAQGQGLACSMLQAMIDTCPSLGIKTLLAFIFGHNTPSLKLFERAGFERWGHFPEVAQLDDDWRDLVILGRKV
jgi:L-amino acid N-acyltransferase YncA